MNRLAVLADRDSAVALRSDLLAQHGGHGGGRRGAPGAGSGDTSDASLTDFNHALAVQATSDQASHFHALTNSTETRKEAGAGPLAAEGRQRD